MTIAVALSGGVDSACAALLLKNAGHKVIGLHMKLMPRNFDSWPKAKSIADSIGIPIHLIDLTEPFQRDVIEYFVSEYASGRTPSPCPRCNRKIKMAVLLEQAMALGAENLATGHYARFDRRNATRALIKGVDHTKDQSYFLFMLNQEILSRVLFPLGELTKVAVRDIAGNHNLPVNLTEESQELCFVPDGMYTDFLLENGIQPNPGPIVDLEGRVLGKHKGIIFYTVGQRRGLGVCGPEPFYVIEIDHNENKIVIGRREATLVSGILVNQTTFVSGSPPKEGDEFRVKVRSTTKEVKCRIEEIQSDFMKIAFEEAQSGVAPGQAAVLYDSDEVIGGGWIERSFR